jgi:hypothetical protein
MHSRSKDKDYVETPNDWYLHAKQEDDVLFPMLMTISISEKMVPDEKERLKLADYVMNLKREHELYIYPYVSKGLLPPEDKMLEHGKKENYIIKKFKKELLSLKTKTSVGKFYTTDLTDVGSIGGNFSESLNFSNAAKITFGIALGGAAFALGAPIFLAAIPLVAAGASVVLPALLSKPDMFSDSVSSLEVALWESNTNIPSDKLNNRGQKFIDPYAIEGACWPEVDRSNVNILMALPKDGKVRVEYMHKNALATKPIVMPAADVLISAADTFESQAIGSVKTSLKERQKWWADKITKYAKYTANGWIIAAAELYASLLKMMPASWNTEYKRATSIAEGTAEELKTTLVTTIGFSIPYPLHTLDGSISSLNDLNAKTKILTTNLKSTLVLPSKAKEILGTFFALLASTASIDVDVQTAINYVDNSDWGKRNLASDEQVYLVGCVLAKSSGLDIIDFTTELWNRSQGWNRFKGLLTNKNTSYLKTESGKIVISATTSTGAFVYNQNQVTGWSNNTNRDSETGWYSAFDCISNARQLNYLDIVLTGFEILSERLGSKSPINNNVLNLNKFEVQELPVAKSETYNVAK